MRSYRSRSADIPVRTDQEAGLQGGRLRNSTSNLAATLSTHSGARTPSAGSPCGTAAGDCEAFPVSASTEKAGSCSSAADENLMSSRDALYHKGRLAGQFFIHAQSWLWGLQALDPAISCSRVPAPPMVPSCNAVHLGWLGGLAFCPRDVLPPGFLAFCPMFSAADSRYHRNFSKNGKFSWTEKFVKKEIYPGLKRFQSRFLAVS